MGPGDKGDLQCVFPSERHFRSYSSMAEVMSGELAIRVIFLHTCLIQHILECDWEDRKVDGVGLPVVPWTVQ